KQTTAVDVLVQLSANTVHEEAVATTEEAPCPNCGAQLSGPTRWCTRCGYCSYLANPVTLDAPTAKQPGMGDLLKVVAASQWLPMLACGLMIIGLGSFSAVLNLREEARARMIWCAGQGVLGALMFIVGGVWSFL